MTTRTRGTGRTRTTSTRTSGTRRRRSTSTTLGGVVGAAIGGALSGLLGHLPWWAWVLLLVVGPAAGYLVHRVRHGAGRPTP